MADPGRLLIFTFLLIFPIPPQTKTKMSLHLPFTFEIKVQVICHIVALPILFDLATVSVSFVVVVVAAIDGSDGGVDSQHLNQLVIGKDALLRPFDQRGTVVLQDCIAVLVLLLLAALLILLLLVDIEGILERFFQVQLRGYPVFMLLWRIRHTFNQIKLLFKLSKIFLLNELFLVDRLRNLI